MGKVLVTGGCGYIGSHFVNYVIDNKIFKKDEMLVIDNLEIGKKENIPEVEFLKIDLKNKKELEKIKYFDIKAVFHFAAYVQVNESVNFPEKYFINNSIGTLNLLEILSKKENDIPFIFSSTAAVYGNPIYLPIDEKHSLNPESPYGASKLNAEEIIKQYSKWKNIKAIVLRYFNVIGSYYSLPTNEQGLPFQLLKALKENKVFYIFGKNYNTKDGTAIRDYIDVLDLIDAHIKAYEFLKDKKNYFNVFNLGTSEGYTVLEVINTFNEILEEKGREKIKFEFRGKREGDVEKIVASNEKAKQFLDWQPKRTLKESLESLIKIYIKSYIL